VTGGAAGQVSPRDSPQLGVKQRHHAVERLFVPSAPCGDQSADVLRILNGHFRTLSQRFGARDPFVSSFSEYKQEDSNMTALFIEKARMGKLRYLFLYTGSVLLVAISIAAMSFAARAQDGAELGGAMAVTATASPNTGNVVFCGGSPLSLAVEAHGNGFTSFGPFNFFLQKTLDSPGLMHGCVTLTAPNGDTLEATYDGTVGSQNANGFSAATGTLTFTGGTGRFKHATGQANFSAEFLGLYPASSFIGGQAGVPLQVSAYYTFDGHVVLEDGD
jgi:hypothetical protein